MKGLGPDKRERERATFESGGGFSFFICFLFFLLFLLIPFKHLMILWVFFCFLRVT